MNRSKFTRIMKGLLSFTLVAVLGAGCGETSTHDDYSENSNTVESGDDTGKTEYAETEVVSELEVEDTAIFDSQGNVTVISDGETGAASGEQSGGSSETSTEISENTGESENTETGESSEEIDEYAEETGGF